MKEEDFWFLLFCIVGVAAFIAMCYRMKPTYHIVHNTASGNYYLQRNGSYLVWDGYDWTTTDVEDIATIFTTREWAVHYLNEYKQYRKVGIRTYEQIE
jgi:hypothetical protein